MPRRHITLEDLKAAAKYYGGRSLAKEYKHMHSPLPWMCRKGHTWDAPFEYVDGGQWCPQCYREEQRRAWLDRMQEFMAKRKGVFISREPEKSGEKVKVRCANKHVFMASAKTTNEGYWCKQCAREATSQRALMRLHTIAKKRGGKCLSQKFPGTNGSAVWQCAKGHVWSCRISNITLQWCKTCVNEKRQKALLKKCHAMAAKRGGKCHAGKVLHTLHKVVWECADHHAWLATPKAILRGRWCPECGDKQRARNRRRHTLEDLQKAARKRGGRLLSKEYTSTETKYQWECAQKHRWYATWANVKHSGYWCQKCYWASRGRDKLGRFK